MKKEQRIPTRNPLKGKEKGREGINKLLRRGRERERVVTIASPAINKIESQTSGRVFKYFVHDPQRGEDPPSTTRYRGNIDDNKR